MSFSSLCGYTINSHEQTIHTSYCTIMFICYFKHVQNRKQIWIYILHTSIFLYCLLIFYILNCFFGIFLLFREHYFRLTFLLLYLIFLHFIMVYFYIFTYSLLYKFKFVEYFLYLISHTRF